MLKVQHTHSTFLYLLLLVCTVSPILVLPICIMCTLPLTRMQSMSQFPPHPSTLFIHTGVGRPIGPCHNGRARIGVAGVQVGRCRSSMTQCSVVRSHLVSLRCGAVSQGVGLCSLSLSQCLSLASPAPNPFTPHDTVLFPPSLSLIPLDYCSPPCPRAGTSTLHVKTSGCE